MYSGMCMYYDCLLLSFDILNTSMSYVISQRLGIDLDRRGMTKRME